MLCATAAISGMAQKKDGYVVAASGAVMNDAGWQKVAKALAGKHKAVILEYDRHPSELEATLRELTPRYLAVVDKPENLDREFVMEGHRLSRRIDSDIYADYLWGIITGYTADDAMQMCERSGRPYVIHTALNTTGELSGSGLFDRMAYLGDGGTPGEWGEKQLGDTDLQRHVVPKWEILGKWVEKYKEIDPDILITSSHATERNLEMPFSLGNLKPQEGRLYADFMTPETLEGTAHPRVYFAAGNCLIGNIARDPGSMAVAWLSGMDATTMVGYVVPTWYGRNGWGGLKFWAANAGRLTLAQALYLNQQDMLHIEHGWSPGMLKVDYPFTTDEFGQQGEFVKRFTEATGNKPTKDQEGFVYDRDVVALYGDPAWDVRLNETTPPGYTVGFKIKGKKCIVTIKTDGNFRDSQMNGKGIKEEHVDDIPFAYFFPKRLRNPRLADGQDWNTALAEDFLLVYDSGFEKNKTYTITLDID